MHHINEFVAAQTCALREFREWVLSHKDEYPESADNWSFMFDAWMARPDVINPINPYTPHMRHLRYKMVLEKLEKS